MKWKVVLEPVAANPDEKSVKEGKAKGEFIQGENQSGLVALLEREGEADDRREVGRVGYIRRNSKNPETTFKEATKRLVDTAVEAADIMNTFEPGVLA